MNWRTLAACIDQPVDLWYPVADIDDAWTPTDTWLQGDNHGTEAKRVCASCPVWAECVTDVVATGELVGVRGGAGGARRRALRRAWRTGGDMWPAALAAHGRSLHSEPAEPGDDVLLSPLGVEANCGHRSTHARGCRCAACRLAAGMYGQAQKPDVSWGDGNLAAHLFPNRKDAA